MEIDDNVYVSRLDLLGVVEGTAGFCDLAETIDRDATGATEITVLGGYYQADALVALCRKVPRGTRAVCVLRIAVGLNAMALVPRTWEDMRDVARQLRRAGFRKATVSVVMNSPVHFHTKLFRILKRTRPVWYVGSANPGSQRHELMVRLVGRHRALTSYVDAVFAKSRVVTDAAPGVEIQTLHDFFLAGVLCHKPPAQRLFTFDAFRFTSEDRERLGEILAGKAGLEHANPKAGGFGFNLRSALGVDQALGPEGADAAADRIHYRRSCVETVFGLWMPSAYANEIRGRVEAEETARVLRLERIAERLADGSGQQQARQAFKAYLASVDRVLTEHRIEARLVRDRGRAFLRFLRSRTETLSSEEGRRRLARTLTLADMPNIFDDVRASREFIDSFFEDLSYRLENQPGGGGRAGRSIAERLAVSGTELPSELRERLKSALATDAWSDADWLDQN